jgi:hypothetical protein
MGRTELITKGFVIISRKVLSVVVSVVVVVVGGCVSVVVVVVVVGGVSVSVSVAVTGQFGPVQGAWRPMSTFISFAAIPKQRKSNLSTSLPSQSDIAAAESSSASFSLSAYAAGTIVVTAVVVNNVPAIRKTNAKMLLFILLHDRYILIVYVGYFRQGYYKLSY